MPVTGTIPVLRFGAVTGSRPWRRDVAYDRLFGDAERLREEVGEVLPAGLGVPLEKDRVRRETVCGTDHGGAGEAVSQAQARTEMAAVPGDPAVFRDIACAADGCCGGQRIVVLHARARAPREAEVIVAEADTHGEFRGGLPAVANVGAEAAFTNGKLVLLAVGNVDLRKEVHA